MKCSCVVKKRSRHAETLRDIERPCGVRRGHHRTWYGKMWVVWLERSFQRYAFQHYALLALRSRPRIVPESKYGHRGTATRDLG